MPNSADRAGFTLVEALVASLLASVVVVLVTSLFLVQNEFYSDVVKRSSLHVNVRGAVSMVSSDLSGITAGGITVAEADSIVFRIPLVIGGVCDQTGSETSLLFPVDGRGVDASNVSGYAVQDASGTWTYNTATWASVYNSSGATPAGRCLVAGADTVGAQGDFFMLNGLVASPALKAGDLVMLFQELELKLATSVLDSVSWAVFRGAAGGTLTELATGLTPGSAFEYRLSANTTFQSRVTGVGDLADIVSIRFNAIGAAPASSAGRDSLTFDLTTTIPLRNAY